MKPLIIRADGSHNIGTGHVMRCLALAEAWQSSGGETFFFIADDAPALERRLIDEGFEVIHMLNEPGSIADANETVRLAQEQGAEWIVVDGYHFGADFQKSIKDSGLSLLFIDDFGHAGHYYADIVLNQNIYADMSFYQHYEPYTRFLLGTKYVLIRKEFLIWAGNYHTIPEIGHKVLITFGGSDPENFTLLVIEALKQVQIDDLEVIAVVGGLNQNYETLQRSVKDQAGFSIRKNVNSMPELMAWADVAVSAGGTTCWELCFLGTPSIVIPIARNQEPTAKELKSHNIAKIFEISDLKDRAGFQKFIIEFLQSGEMRSFFSNKMAEYVDGKGPSRIISTIGFEKLKLRNVELSDCKKIWFWINDPLVRSVSFNSEPISLERHMEWFSSALIDPNLIYYIAEDKNANLIGQARFQIEAEEAVISVLIDPEYRGRSLGTLLIQDATERLFFETNLEKIYAFIKMGNEASRKAFAKAGYKEYGLRDYHGENAYILIKGRWER